MEVFNVILPRTLSAALFAAAITHASVIIDDFERSQIVPVLPNSVSSTVVRAPGRCPVDPCPPNAYQNDFMYHGANDVMGGTGYRLVAAQRTAGTGVAGFFPGSSLEFAGFDGISSGILYVVGSGPVYTIQPGDTDVTLIYNSTGAAAIHLFLRSTAGTYSGAPAINTTGGGIQTVRIPLSTFVLAPGAAIDGYGMLVGQGPVDGAAGSTGIYSMNIVENPEPATMALVGGGMVALFLIRRRTAS